MPTVPKYDHARMHKLRKAGYTFSEIGKDVGCSPVTAYLACKGVYPTTVGRRRYAAKAHERAVEHGRLRGAVTAARYRSARAAAYADVGEVTDADVFFAGVYAGEGGKSRFFAVSNSNPSLIRCAVDFLVRRGVPLASIKLEVQAYADSPPDAELKAYWGAYAPDVRIYRRPSKPDRHLRKGGFRSIPFGTCNVLPKHGYGLKAFEWVYAIMDRYSRMQRGKGVSCQTSEEGASS